MFLHFDFGYRDRVQLQESEVGHTSTIDNFHFETNTFFQFETSTFCYLRHFDFGYRDSVHLQESKVGHTSTIDNFPTPARAGAQICRVLSRVVHSVVSLFQNTFTNMITYQRL